MHNPGKNRAVRWIALRAGSITMSRRTLRLWLTLLVTGEPLSSQTNGTPVQIADADPLNARHRP
jgi:hypothetical protein